MNKKCILKIISILLCFVILLGYPQICATAITQPNATGDTVTVNFLFAFFRSEPNLSISTIKGIFWHDRKVKVLGYSGSFVYVQDSKSKDEGYIHELLLNDKPLNIRQQYVNIYKGATKTGIVTINYDKDGMLEWSVSQSGIVEVTKYSNRSLSVKGLSPGTVTLTVKCNGNKDTCDIACIEQWSDTETATAQTSIKVMGIPGKEYKGAKTIPEGATITARGNIPNNSAYVYVSSGDIWGFINLSDFPTIKYMMTEYHYYDEGYKKRFSSPNTKIADYASVLNDVMMANFGLKVCYYIEPYTSAADKCKKWKYGDDYLDYLSGSCPKTENHNPDSCLRTIHMRDVLLEDKGWGTDVITKAVWTGHIMDGHKPSNSEIVSQTLVFTTANTVSYSSGTYSNKSPSYLRYYSLYEITHETGHQLGLNDGYCYKDGNGKHCSNSNCFYCNGEPIPNCIMAQIKSPTNSTNMFCDDCKEKINSHLKDHH